MKPRSHLRRMLGLLAAALPLAGPARACFPADGYDDYGDDYATGASSYANGFTSSELGGGDPNAPAWANSGLFISQHASPPDPVYADPDDGGGAGDDGSGGDNAGGGASDPAPPAASPPADPPVIPDPPPPAPVAAAAPVPTPDPPPAPVPAPPDSTPAPPDPPAPAVAPPPPPTAAITMPPPPAQPVAELTRIRFNATGRDAHVINQNSPMGSTFIWTDPGSLLLSPWPAFSGAQAAPAGAANAVLPAVPVAPPGAGP